MVRFNAFHPKKVIKQYTFLFSSSDWLAIYDFQSNASPFLEYHHCGDSLPPSQISSSNQLFFYFQSDVATTGTGFKLEYYAASKSLYKVDS